jgi:hypothetical protein
MLDPQHMGQGSWPAALGFDQADHNAAQPHLAIELRGRGLVELDSVGQACCTNGLQQVEDSNAGGLCCVLRSLKTDLHVGLRSQVVHLVRLDGSAAQGGAGGANGNDCEPRSTFQTGSCPPSARNSRNQGHQGVEVKQVAVVQVEVLVVGVLCEARTLSMVMSKRKPVLELSTPSILSCSACQFYRCAILNGPGCRMCSRRGWL